jgi:hypothetical protein
MKPTEGRILTDVTERALEHAGLPYPCSMDADPPIVSAEARVAETATCRKHDGAIGKIPRANDIFGAVYFCPIGRQYWRYTKQDGKGLYAPLKWKW